MANFPGPRGFPVRVPPRLMPTNWTMDHPKYPGRALNDFMPVYATTSHAYYYGRTAYFEDEHEALAEQALLEDFLALQPAHIVPDGPNGKWVNGIMNPPDFVRPWPRSGGEVGRYLRAQIGRPLRARAPWRMPERWFPIERPPPQQYQGGWPTRQLPNAAFPTHHVTQAGVDACVMCAQAMLVGEAGVVRCQNVAQNVHVYHIACLDTWLNPVVNNARIGSNNACPYCHAHAPQHQ